MSDDFGAGLILGTIFVLMLWSFTPNSTSKGDVVNKAIERCSNNEGIKKMRLDYGGGKVWCNNGATFGLGD